MATLLRRFLLLQLLILWQGGFLFYALVVVPTGGNVLGSELQQGLITQRVTVWLNYFGAAFLLFAMFELKRESQNRLRLVLLILACALQASLFLLHRTLDDLIDFEDQTLRDSRRFYEWHRVYLIVSALLWLVMLLYSYLMLRIWTRTGDSTK